MVSLTRLVLFAVILLPMTSSAADLTFDVTGAADWDSNVFRRDNNSNGNRNIEDDFLFRLRPGVRLHEDRGQDFDYSAKYTLPLEVAVEHSQLDDIDHMFDGSTTYHPSDRTEIYASNAFRYLRSTLVNSIDRFGNVEQGRDRVTTNDATLGAHYQVSPRLRVNTAATHRLFRTTRADRQDNQSASGGVDTYYTLSARHQAGLGARYIFQHFQESRFVGRNDAHSVNIYAQWKWQLDKVTAFDAAVGPTIISIEQDIAGAQGNHDQSVDVFASAGITRRWTPTIRTGAKYERTQGVASGVGGSVIVDSVTGTANWDFRERWEAILRGDFVRRESVTDVGTQNTTLDSEVKSDRWSVSLEVAHWLKRKTRIFGKVRYNDQTSKGNSLAGASDFEDWIISFGMYHTFEPIKLW